MLPFLAVAVVIVSMEALVGDAKGLSGRMCSTTPLQFKRARNVSVPNGKDQDQTLKKGDNLHQDTA